MVQNSFQLQKRIKNYSNDPKNVSRHCGGHYNIKIKHFEDFSGGGLLEPPLMSKRVKYVNYISEYKQDMNYTSKIILPKIKSTFPSSSLTSSPPTELYTVMGIWASATGLVGVVANISAIGVFFKVKKVN